jgi:hypothetical protein
MTVHHKVYDMYRDHPFTRPALNVQQVHSMVLNLTLLQPADPSYTH